jgi:hypothetical protein
MLDRTIVLWTIAACMLATPVAAQAPAPTMTAFDGTYVGVSRTFAGKADAGAPTRNCVPNGQPGPLTIASGVARYPTLRAGTWEGSVNAQGVLVMHSRLGERFDAQIDARGTVIGRFSGECGYHMVWQKEGK